MLLRILRNKFFLIGGGGLLLSVVLVLGLLNLLTATGHRPLIFTASASLQPGVYLRKFFQPAVYGDNIFISLGAVKRAHLAQFYPQPINFLLKQVTGQSGDRVCWTSWSVVVQRATTGKQIFYPVLNRTLFLPGVNNQCEIIGVGEFFVVGTHPESFDSRYFGLILPTEAGAPYYSQPIFS